MASTIQIKRGTGSAAPSSLVDGELAINLDSGKLYYGSGSAALNSFSFTNISASGTISASGFVYGRDFFDNQVNINTIYSPIAGGSNIVTVGALAGGTIATGFGAIDNGTSGIRSNNITALTSFLPAESDNTTLGTVDLHFSDLFLGEGGVINFDAGDVTITQTGNNLAIAGTENTSFVGHITASGNISSSGTITGNSIVGTIGTATQGTIDHDSLANFIANEHIDHSDVSITAGTGLTGGGTIASTRTLNVIGGTGVTANANDIAIGQDVATTANVQFNHITASGNLEVAGNISGSSTSTGSFGHIDDAVIRGKQIEILNTSFKDDLGSGTEIWVPLNSTVEGGSISNLNTPFITPCAGKLLKILYRSNADNTGATATWRLRKVADGSTVGLGTGAVVGTQTVTGPDTDEVVTVDFRGVDSNAFNAKDMLLFSIEHNADVGGEILYFVTIVLELDYDTLGY